ncbi:hypothetical protein [Pseudomonas sp. OV546]|uniref:hypothetical protein n=1 Tax=Pseudomonas sp. OV546 TaxID=1881063 RepID=UPI0008E34455|nr:hypothetical protein [Pseudomonas sp. OV546]SFU95144.1 hypothetical protein SAMN05428951_10740 [Pseudomonas sp. OV546]
MKDSIAQYVALIVNDVDIAIDSVADVETILTKAEIKTQEDFISARSIMRDMSGIELQQLVYMLPERVRQEFDDE